MHSSVKLSDDPVASAPPYLVFIRTSKDLRGGSFGAIVRAENTRWAFGARESSLSPNAMELVGAERTLNGISDRCGPSSIKLFASEYLSGGYERLPIWELQDWIRDTLRTDESQQVDVANIGLWQSLQAAARKHDSVEISTIRSNGKGKHWWRSEREAARAIAKTVGLKSLTWCDVTHAFWPTFALSNIFPDNDNT